MIAPDSDMLNLGRAIVLVDNKCFQPHETTEGDGVDMLKRSGMEQ